jgi:acyl-CoA dehydrogenase
VLVDKSNAQLEQISDWDTLGFRGTCSAGFVLKAKGHIKQIQPVPFADILAQTMHPVSHLVWGSLWLGLAQDAVTQARATVRSAARKNPSNPPVSALRLTEVDEELFSMRSGLQTAIDEYQKKLDANNPEAFSDFGFSIRINNVKLRCSEMVVKIVSDALSIVGIAGYKNNTPNSLARHVRDAFGAALMVNNDRIRGHNSTMQIMVRDSQ